MSTLNCTMTEFRRGYVEFRNAMCNRTKTQDEVANGYKCLVLLYLGLVPETSDHDVELAAMLIEQVALEAFKRGWTLVSETMA